MSVSTEESFTNLMYTFRHYQTEARFVDLKIVGQDANQKFNCHKLVLSSASEFLRKILTEERLRNQDWLEEDQITVIIPQMRPDVLVKLANYVYGGMIHLDVNDQDAIAWLKLMGIPMTTYVIKEERNETGIKNSVQSKTEQAMEEADLMLPHVRLQCPFKNCSRLCLTREEITNHIASEHKNSPTKPPSSCKLCGKKFTSSNKLSLHMNAVHNRADSSTEKITSPDKFPCLIKGCEKSFKSKKYLMQHARTHDKSKGINCDLCHKTLAGPRELRAHLRLHTGEKPYACLECNMTFRNRSTCNTHLKMHTNQRNHICNECGHAFIQLADLRKHMRSKHTNEKPFSCDKCSKAFARSDYLLKHQRAHLKKENQAALEEEDDQQHQDVNTLLSEAMLNDEDVGLEGLETTGTIELVLPGTSTQNI